MLKSFKNGLLAFSASSFLFSCAPKLGLEGSDLANSGLPVPANSEFALSTVAIGKPYSEDETTYACPSDPVGAQSTPSPRPLQQTDAPACRETPRPGYQVHCTGVIVGTRTLVTAEHCLPKAFSREEALKEALDDFGQIHPSSEGRERVNEPNSEPRVYESEIRLVALFGVDSINPRSVIEVGQSFTWNYRGISERSHLADPSDRSKLLDRYKDRENDIAVLLLRNDIPAGFKPANLPRRADAHVPYDQYRAAWIVGFGRQGDEWRRRAAAKKRTPGVMNHHPATIDRSSSSAHLGLFNLEHSSACHGDSGGPLYKVKDPNANQPSIDYLLGIASWVSDPKNCSGDAFYLDIRQFLGFIADPSKYSKPVSYPRATFKWRFDSDKLPKNNSEPSPSSPPR
jgi:hypothetical protein